MQHQIDELNKQLKLKEMELAFHHQLFESMGLSSDLIRESFGKINNYRMKLANGLTVEDEEAVTQFETYAAQVQSELFLKNAGLNRERYEELCIEEFDSDNWHKLDDASQNFILTAKITFDSMKKIDVYNTMDYSGVCLLITKSLEVEIVKRFYTRYLTYLQEKYSSYSNWPHSMLDKTGTRPLKDHEFTLGSVVSVCGLRRIYQNDELIDIRRGNQAIFNKFIDYCQEVLFTGLTRSQAESNILDDGKFIEKVRIDYRNPSAHRGNLNQITALECLNYVIDVQKKLKYFLSQMNV